MRFSFVLKTGNKLFPKNLFTLQEKLSFDNVALFQSRTLKQQLLFKICLLDMNWLILANKYVLIHKYNSFSYSIFRQPAKWITDIPKKLMISKRTYVVKELLKLLAIDKHYWNINMKLKSVNVCISKISLASLTEYNPMLDIRIHL